MTSGADCPGGLSIVLGLFCVFVSSMSISLDEMVFGDLPGRKTDKDEGMDFFLGIAV